MHKFAVLFVALVACIAVIDALPKNHRRYRPLARYQQRLRYNPRLAQYNRYRPARLVDEAEEAESDVPVLVLPEDFPFTDLTELAGLPFDVPAVDEPVPADDEVPLSASPDESADHETRVLPEPEYRAATASADFFSLRFGRVNEGAVAVANSYSTGNGGKSESRAVAFGNPAAAAKFRRRH